MTRIALIEAAKSGDRRKRFMVRWLSDVRSLIYARKAVTFFMRVADEISQALENPDPAGPGRDLDHQSLLEADGRRHSAAACEAEGGVKILARGDLLLYHPRINA